MYSYETEKQKIFTGEGQKMFLSIRNKVKNTIKIAGCVRMDKAILEQTGSSWEMLACVDRLVELGEIIEITKNMNVADQDRIFRDNY